MHGLIEYERGPTGIVASSRRSDFNHELRIDGARGHLLLPVAWRIEASTEVLARRSVGWGRFETTPHPIPAIDSYRARELCAAVRGKRTPMPSLAESMVNLLTLDVLLANAPERSPVTVDLPSFLRAA